MKYLILVILSINSYSLESHYFKKNKFDNSQRELSIIVTDEGFYPKKPVVFVGEKIRLFVTSTTDMPTCLIIKNKEVFLEAKKGEISEAEVFFDKAQEVELYCPGNKNKSHIVVLEHPKDEESRLSREIAAEKAKNLKIWRPRDE